jgi:hypothetical protein
MDQVTHNVFIINNVYSPTFDLKALLCDYISNHINE